MALLNTIERRWPDRVRSAARWLLLLALLFGACVAPRAAAQTTPSREYQIKAVFLFNFLQFVDWPPSAFSGETSPVIIGVLGDDPFGSALDEAVRGESLRNRPIIVRRSHRAEDLADSHLLFICKSEQRKLTDILSLIDTRPVLTVSELTGFARQGGVIGFYQDGKKLRFEINPSVAQKSGLKLSSEMLELGRIIRPEPAREGS